MLAGTGADTPGRQAAVRSKMLYRVTSSTLHSPTSNFGLPRSLSPIGRAAALKFEAKARFQISLSESVLEKGGGDWMNGGRVGGKRERTVSSADGDVVSGRGESS